MKQAEQDTPPVNDEQAADLAALQAAASEGATSGVAKATSDVAAEESGPDLAHELAGLLKVAVAALSPIYPSLKTIYTDETTAAASNAIALVCKKHGWLANGMMGNYGEEIACIAIVGPLALSTYQGVTADIAARKAQERTAKLEGATLAATIEAPTAPAGANSKTVTFGAPTPAEA